MTAIPNQTIRLGPVQHQLLQGRNTIGAARGGGLFVSIKQIANQLEDCKVLDFFGSFDLSKAK